MDFAVRFYLIHYKPSLKKLGLHPSELRLQVRRHHIFTHIRWDMTGIYVEVREPGGDYLWLTPEQIEKEAALPTAFRQFWEEPNHV